MKALIYGKANCPNCQKAKSLCESKGIIYEYKVVGTDVTREQLEEHVGQPIRSVPQIFVMADGFAEYVGGYPELRDRLNN